ncbi:DUF29 domain-containing protein [Dolichospermum heterosporum]|uniref:DUF29 domain-containing protein n=1 Tax=Dolichospermum heterosporum TAC447 TaxID=747523 RepID=A0ABY5LZX0_9CYAN|nr:DUF29 domain-containing protein [Dolichospermum heterosporum]UUO16170.1 DUF29 domain-containing protein [Dolichospermum heterosporum TAC447]
MTRTPIAVSLYEQDYLLWIEDIVHKLRNRDIEGLDIDNLIEEIEDLGRSDKRELENRLAELLEHILKRNYVHIPDCYLDTPRSKDTGILNRIIANTTARIISAFQVLP